MAIETVCQTSGAHFNIGINPHGITVRVSKVQGPMFNLSEDEAKLLEANIHNALELVLIPYFR